MKEQAVLRQAALEYLERDRLLHMDMLEPIRRGQAEILKAGPGGVLIYETRSRTHMLSAESLEAGKALCCRVEQPYLFVAHDRENAEYFRGKYGFQTAQECWAAAYLGNVALPVPGDIEIRRLGEEYFEIINANYSTFSGEEYIRDRIREGVMQGAFRNGVLLGFAGMHPEGSVGMLEVLPEYRRQGAATALMAAMVNFCLERGCVPFSQIFAGNEASLGLHRKMGFTIAQRPMYWVMNND